MRLSSSLNSARKKIEIKRPIDAVSLKAYVSLVISNAFHDSLEGDTKTADLNSWILGDIAELEKQLKSLELMAEEKRSLAGLVSNDFTLSPRLVYGVFNSITIANTDFKDKTKDLHKVLEDKSFALDRDTLKADLRKTITNQLHGVSDDGQNKSPVDVTKRVLEAVLEWQNKIGEISKGLEGFESPVMYRAALSPEFVFGVFEEIVLQTKTSEGLKAGEVYVSDNFAGGENNIEILYGLFKSASEELDEKMSLKSNVVYDNWIGGILRVVDDVKSKNIESEYGLPFVINFIPKACKQLWHGTYNQTFEQNAIASYAAAQQQQVKVIPVKERPIVINKAIKKIIDDIKVSEDCGVVRGNLIKSLEDHIKNGGDVHPKDVYNAFYNMYRSNGKPEHLKPLLEELKIAANLNNCQDYKFEFSATAKSKFIVSDLIIRSVESNIEGVIGEFKSDNSKKQLLAIIKERLANSQVEVPFDENRWKKYIDDNSPKPGLFGGLFTADVKKARLDEIGGNLGIVIKAQSDKIEEQAIKDRQEELVTVVVPFEQGGWLKPMQHESGNIVGWAIEKNSELAEQKIENPSLGLVNYIAINNDQEKSEALFDYAHDHGIRLYDNGKSLLVAAYALKKELRFDEMETAEEHILKNNNMSEARMDVFMAHYENGGTELEDFLSSIIKDPYRCDCREVARYLLLNNKSYRDVLSESDIRQLTESPNTVAVRSIFFDDKGVLELRNILFNRYKEIENSPKDIKKNSDKQELLQDKIKAVEAKIAEKQVIIDKLEQDNKNPKKLKTAKSEKDILETQLGSVRASLLKLETEAKALKEPTPDDIRNQQKRRRLYDLLTSPSITNEKLKDKKTEKRKDSCNIVGEELKEFSDLYKKHSPEEVAMQIWKTQKCERGTLKQIWQNTKDVAGAVGVGITAGYTAKAISSNAAPLVGAIFGSVTFGLKKVWNCVADLKDDMRDGKPQYLITDKLKDSMDADLRLKLEETEKALEKIKAKYKESGPLRKFGYALSRIFDNFIFDSSTLKAIKVVDKKIDEHQATIVREVGGNWVMRNIAKPIGNTLEAVGQSIGVSTRQRLGDGQVAETKPRIDEKKLAPEAKEVATQAKAVANTKAPGTSPSTNGNGAISLPEMNLSRVF